jgi:thiamine pyrophosphate-dependent acetolactate synthase large subunit-like protein
VARRPIVIVGNGARLEMEPIVELAERHGAPVITTFEAKGQIPERTRSPRASAVAPVRRSRAGS